MTPVVAATLPLAHAAQAHQTLERSGPAGRILLEPAAAGPTITTEGRHA